MGRTSTEVKQRYNNKTYKRIVVSLRYDSDKELLDFIDANKEKIGTSQLFREALNLYIKESTK